MSDSNKWAWEDEDDGIELFNKNDDKGKKEDKSKLTDLLPKIENEPVEESEELTDLLHDFINTKEDKTEDMVLNSTNYKTTKGATQIEDSSLSWNTFSGFKNVKKEEKEVLSPSNNLKAIGSNSLHEAIIKDKPISRSKELTQEDYDKAKEKWDNELSPEVKETPINNDVTREAIVSSSGMSLSDYLYNKYNKNKKVHSDGNLQIKDKNKEFLNKEVVPWENDVFVESVKEAENNKKQIAKLRRKLSNPEKISVEDFEKENIKPSKYEKQILKTLGITQDDLGRLVSPDSSLTEYEKAKLVSVGYFGTKPLGKGVRNSYAAFATIGDLHYLYFLDKFKYATTFNLSLAVGKSYTSARGTMQKLFTMGLVNKIPILNAPTMWSLTPTGLATINSDKPLPSSRSAEPSALSERVYVNYIAACLFSNEINALNLEDFPYKGRPFQGELVRGEDLISEAETLSSMYREMSNLIPNVYEKDSYKGERFDLMTDKWEIDWRRWEREGKKGSPEKMPGNEYMYILFSKSPFTNKFLVPDIVVSRPRDPDGTPNNIAIEVERSIKSEEDYRKKLLAYKEDTRVYGKVVYITPLNSIANKVSKVASDIDFDRFDIMPPMDRNGPTREIAGWLMM